MQKILFIFSQILCCSDIVDQGMIHCHCVALHDKNILWNTWNTFFRCCGKH